MHRDTCQPDSPYECGNDSRCGTPKARADSMMPYPKLGRDLCRGQFTYKVAMSSIRWLELLGFAPS